MKFKCIECNTTFSAGSRQEAVCPTCQSNNVVAQGSNRKPILVIGGLLVVTVAAVVVPMLVKHNDTDITTTIAPIPVEYGLDFKSLNAVDAPVFDPKSKTFSVTVKAEFNQPNDLAIVYSVLIGGEKITSNSGHFDKLPPSESGSYRFIASTPNDPSIDPYSARISGFTVPEPAIVKVEPEQSSKPTNPVVTIETVQGWVNKLKAGGSNPLIDSKNNNLVQPGCKFILSGLSADDSHYSTCSSMTVQEKLFFGDWSGVQVTGITCNPANGKLQSVNAKVIY